MMKSKIFFIIFAWNQITQKGKEKNKTFSTFKEDTKKLIGLGHCWAGIGILNCFVGLKFKMCGLGPW